MAVHGMTNSINSIKSRKLHWVVITLIIDQIMTIPIYKWLLKRNKYTIAKEGIWQGILICRSNKWK